MIKFLFKTLGYLRYKGFYIFTNGKYMGEFFTYIKEYSDEKNVACLLMPNPTKATFFDRNIMKNSIKNGMIKYVKILPNDVYDVCKANFEFYKEKDI